MAKVLTNITMFLPGNPESSSPNSVFVTYAVEDGNAKKTDCMYEAAEPDFTDTLQTLWDEAIAQIKINEGIS